MAIADDTVPAPRPLRRDILENEEDVTAKSERDLILRALNSTLRTEYENGQILSGIARMERRHDGFDLRLGSIDDRIYRIEGMIAPGGAVEQRAAQASRPAIEELAPAIAAEMRRAFLDPRDGHGNLSEARAVEIMTRLLKDQKLEGYESSAKEAKKLRTQIKAGAVVAAITILLTAVAAHFEGRASSHQTTQVHP